MKIFDPGIYQLKGDTHVSKEHKKEEVNGPSFSEILENTTSSNGAGKVEKALGTEILGPQDTLNSAQKDALAKGEEILGLLNHLGGVMESSGINDSVARSAAEAISGRVEELRQIRDGLEPSDPLRDTLNEIGTLSIVEQFKITRGDYG